MWCWKPSSRSSLRKSVYGPVRFMNRGQQAGRQACTLTLSCSVQVVEGHEHVCCAAAAVE